MILVYKVLLTVLIYESTFRSIDLNLILSDASQGVLNIFERRCYNETQKLFYGSEFDF